MSLYPRLARGASLFLVLPGVLSATPAVAQPLPGRPPIQTAALPPDAAPTPMDVDAQVAQGQSLLSARDPRAIDVLAAAAASSAAQLGAAGGNALLVAAPDAMPHDGYLGTLAGQAARAHLWWGIACDSFGRRIEAVTALARAARFAGPERYGDTTARDARLGLDRVLNGGLPLVVPDDVLDTLAQTTYNNNWKPQRFRADFADPSGHGTITREFVLTDGILLTPSIVNNADPTAGYQRVPPLYRNVPKDKLPPALQLDKMIVGFTREVSGPNIGQWRQVVQVFYGSAYITTGQRDDRPRAEALCEQFLKVRSLFDDFTGLQNPYARDGVTKLYLAEISALWPNDDDDPVVAAAQFARMPPANTPLVRGASPNPTPQVVESPLTHPWNLADDPPPPANPDTAAAPVTPPAIPIVGAAQTDAAPGEITFYKSGLARPESEWLRELAHEYSHVVIPPFGRFAPPNEPYANGTIGETLAMMWVAQNLPAFTSHLPPPETVAAALLTGNTPRPTSASQTDSGTAPVFPVAGPQEISATDLRAHIGQNALSSLRFWQSRGPGSPLSRSPSPDGWRYLQGLAVYLERVYGARLTGDAMRQFSLRPGSVQPVSSFRASVADTPRPLSAADLMSGLSTAWRDPFERVAPAATGPRALPIWLPGAMDGIVTRADDLIARSAFRLEPGARVGAWLWVPPTARRLRVEWHGTGSLRVDEARLTAAPDPQPNTSAIFVDLTGRSGWQRLTFTPAGDVALSAAQFERG